MAIVYVKHPVSAETKAKIVSAGDRIVDAVFAPDGAEIYGGLHTATIAKPAPGADAEKQELVASVAASGHDGTAEVGFNFAKGPRGLWYVMRDGVRSSPGYASEDEARASIATGGGE